MHRNLTPPATQQRLMDALISAIYRLIDILYPIVATVETDTSRSWTQRTALASRFWVVIRELLAVTARIEPGTLSTAPSFPVPKPAATPRASYTERLPPIPHAGPRTRAGAPPFSARRLAQRLATLLHYLQCLLAEAAVCLTASFMRHTARIRAIAGCDALPRPALSWERAG